MNIFVTVLTLAAVFASSDAGPQGRIKYGQFADERQFPFHVGISARRGPTFEVKFGGVIISNYWVLTAAHCVIGMKKVTLHIGSNNFSAPELTLTVKKKFITVHPGYKRTNRNNDIALLNTTYIKFTNTINKVVLPSMRDVGDVANEKVTVIGWGLDEYDQYYEQKLKYTFLRVMTIGECRPFLKDEGVDAKKTLCARTSVSLPCYGDTGGPLIMSSNSILVGITTSGKKFCTQREPALFVRVTKYLRWIRNVSGVY